MNQPRFAVCESKNLGDPKKITAGITPRNKTRTRTAPSAENGFEHILLKAANDWITVDQIQNRRMTFDNTRSALVAVGKLGHVALTIADVGEPFGPFGQCLSLRSGFEPCGLFFKD